MTRITHINNNTDTNSSTLGAECVIKHLVNTLIAILNT